MTSTALQTRVGNLTLKSPLVIASGVWPLERDLWPREPLPFVGAVCTKGLTLAPRPGNPGTRVWETPAGMLNSVGLQNGGVRHFVQEELPELAREGVPLVANVAPLAEEDFAPLFEALDRRAADLAAVELNLSCPNVACGGAAWGRTAEGVARAVALARSRWQGSLWVKLTPQAGDLVATARAAEEQGADAVVVANTWLGLAFDLERRRPALARTVGGLSGPAIFPLALRWGWEVAGDVYIPVVGCGGVTTGDDVLSMLLAGASAVEIGTALLADLGAAETMLAGVREHLARGGCGDLASLVGAGRHP